MKSFSLDTAPDLPRTLITGYNFREVAPEVLSPLAWSVIGAGMERGFRTVAARMGIRDAGARPRYVAYLSFRPFHVATAFDRIVARMPWFEPADVWELVFGGRPPTGAVSTATARRRLKVRSLPGELRLAHENGVRIRDLESMVTAAEQETLLALRGGSSWRYGAAWDAAVSASRAAWALHVQTSGIAVATCAIYRVLLRRVFDEPDVELLLRTTTRRRRGENASGYTGGLLSQAAARRMNYEVADGAPALDRWQLPEAVSVNDSTSRAGVLSLAEHVRLPGVSAALARKWREVLEIGLAERERSKAIALRALHCLRCLVDVEAPGLPVEDAAFLGVDEIARLSPPQQVPLIDLRRSELTEAADLQVAVDLRFGPEGWSNIRRDPPELGAGATGTCLTPGWGEGILVRPGDAPADGQIVLFGERVEAMDVLRIRPAAVVSRYGSVLSHLAIVCRELGIPLVAGIEVRPTDAGRLVEVDGESGRVGLTDE